MLWDDHGVWSYYEYGSVVWLWWLDHAYGDGTGSVAPELWAAMTQEGYGDEPDLLDAWDDIAGGWQASFLDFTADRARMGGDEGPDWLAFAGESGRVARAEIAVQPPAELSPALPPFPLGAVFYDIEAEQGDSLELTLESAEAVDWALLVVEPGGEAAIMQGEELSYGPLANGQATVIVANLGPADMDADDPLRAADFTLQIDSGGCGCSSRPGGVVQLGWALLAGLGLCARRRKSR